MKIEIEDKGTLNLPLTQEFVNGNSNIVEVTESPTGMGTSMVSWRPDQTEGGLALESHFRGQEGASSGKDPNFIDLRLPLDELNVIFSMNPRQVSL
jgi:hypothetical protein